MIYSSYIETDLHNPGQFFACCGLLYCADRLLDGAKGHFNDNRFVLQACEPDPAPAVIKRLKHCVGSIVADTDDATSPVHIKDIPVRLDFWEHLDDRPVIKLFAGQMQSKKIIERWAQHLQKYSQNKKEIHLWTGFTALDLPSGIDAATRWTAQDVGFSLEVQKKKNIQTHPLVEFFAHIGVQSYCWRKNENTHEYYTWNSPLPMLIAAPVAAGAIPPMIHDRFEFQVESNGSNKTFNMSYKKAIA